ncbi:NAD-dependent epimerase/dehydratase family protein [Roseibium sp. M-1]
MRCLVVGGTGFLGGAIADTLVTGGHEVTVLSRGWTSRQAGSPVEVIRADRHGELDVLAGRQFDWAFDSCAYAPDAVAALLDAVGDGLQRYVFISSISAYGDFLEPGLQETAEVRDAAFHDLEVAANIPPESRASAFAYGASYGPLKRACEIKASQMLGTRATSLRVGLLAGAGDYTDRLTWWVRRLDEANGHRVRVPAPAPKDRPVQLIDARDVAEFALLAASKGYSGIWNITGEPQSFAGVLDAILTVSGSTADLVWVDEEAIQKAQVAPWTDLPMMAPLDPAFRHFLEVSTEKARSAGLRCRPLKETLEPLLAWDRSRRKMDLRVGLTPEQEMRLLA